MRKKQLSVLILLCVGMFGLYAYAGVKSLPSLPDKTEENTDLPATPAPDLKELKQWKAKIDKKCKVDSTKAYYQAIQLEKSYLDAVAIIDKSAATTQDEVNELVNSLKQEFVKSPLECAKKKLVDWYEAHYGKQTDDSPYYTPDEYTRVYNDGDIVYLKGQIEADLLSDLDKITEAYVDTAIIQAQKNITRSSLASKYDNEKQELKSSKELVEKNTDGIYTATQGSAVFTTVKDWFQTKPSFTYTDYNLTAVTLYSQYLAKEISYADLISIYKKSNAETKKLLDSYFTSEEKNNGNADYADVIKPINNFSAALNNLSYDVKKDEYTLNGKTYKADAESSAEMLLKGELNNLQSLAQGVREVLAQKLLNYQKALRDTCIIRAERLYVNLLPSGSEATSLNGAIRQAKTVSATSTQILSCYKNARIALDKVYDTTHAYYIGWQTHCNKK